MDKKNFCSKLNLPNGYTLYPLNLDINKTWILCYYDIYGSRIRIRKGINSLKSVDERIEKIKEIIANHKQDNVFVKNSNSKCENEDNTLSSFNEQTLFKAIEKRVKANSLRRKTRQGYQSVVRQFCGHINTRLSEVTKEDAKNYLYSILQKVTPTTANNHKVMLCTLYEDLIDDNIDNIKINPFKRIKRFRQVNQGYLPFKSHQIELIKRELIKMPQVWLMCQIIYYSFLRPVSEARLLQIKHIDLIDAKIILPASISKTNKTRVIPISEHLLAIFFEMELYKYPKEYYLLGKGGKPDQRCWGINHFTNKHNMVLKKLGFNPQLYSLYGWKNTGMLKAFLNGKSLKKIQIYSGHTSLDMLDKYLRSIGAHDIPGINKIHPKL